MSKGADDMRQFHKSAGYIYLFLLGPAMAILAIMFFAVAIIGVPDAAPHVGALSLIVSIIITYATGSLATQALRWVR
jgi:hypothetical protein